MKRSRFVSTENLNITYLLGAGASYSSVPIWNKQGESLLTVSKYIEVTIKNNNLKSNSKHKTLFFNHFLIELIDKLKFYANKAEEFGTLDIFARSLFLLDKMDDLNDLKFHLSIYFDIWENFCYKENLLDEENNIAYSKVDKRYYSLLSVLLSKGKKNPVLNNNVSFISWNYDLQLESAYKSFMFDSEKKSFEDVNLSFNFYENETNNVVTHLNGFRGFFNYENELFSNVKNTQLDTIENYLLGLLENLTQFRSNIINYTNNIKYAWESEESSLKSASDLIKKTNILIIIGYSFPSYNRHIDSMLIDSLGEDAQNQDIKEIIYQNPNANNELLENIFNKEVIHIKNTEQFYIPHEFLFPKKAEDITF